MQAQALMQPANEVPREVSKRYVSQSQRQTRA